MSFANLKTNRTDVSKLVSAVQEASGATTQKKSYEDERFWKPTVDESGNGYAVIRFLPAGVGQELPWVRYFDHLHFEVLFHQMVKMYCNYQHLLEPLVHLISQKIMSAIRK